MHKLKKISLILFVLGLLLAVLIFVLENQQPNTVSFLGWVTLQLPISAFMMVSLLVGMLIGSLMFGLVFGRNKN